MRLVGFSGEINRGIHYLGSEDNDIINQYLGKPKGGQFQSLLFSLILQPVRINKPGAPLLGLAKSIYLSSADVFDKTSNLAISRCCFAYDGKEIDKIENARAGRAKLTMQIWDVLVAVAVVIA